MPLALKDFEQRHADGVSHTFRRHGLCGEQSPLMGGIRNYCTNAPFHEGAHEARRADGSVMARWLEGRWIV